MEKLIKKEGVYYTQVANDYPIEERTFFKAGLVANLKDWREATAEEVAEWEKYQKKQQEEMEAMA